MGIKGGVVKNKYLPQISTYHNLSKRGVNFSHLPFCHGPEDEFSTRPRDKKDRKAHIFCKKSVQRC